VAAYRLDVAEAKASTAEKAMNAAKTPLMTIMVSVGMVFTPWTGSRDTARIAGPV
jgi:ABC-type iron transport system FetAB permease component